MVDFFYRYGFWGGVKLFKNYIFTRILYPSCRLIRFPFDIRNSSNINLGYNLTAGVGARIEAYGSGTILFGNNIQINDYVHISAFNSVTIDDDVLIASKVFITDLSHGIYGSDLDSNNCSSPYEIAKDRPLFGKPVYINRNVWIGENVVVLPGVVIGENTIIGANSTVTKNLDANCIYAGNPCRLIKRWNEKSQSWEVN